MKKNIVDLKKNENVGSQERAKRMLKPDTSNLEAKVLEELFYNKESKTTIKIKLEKIGV